MDGHQDLPFMELLADTASNRKQAPLLREVLAQTDKPLITKAFVSRMFPARSTDVLSQQHPPHSVEYQQPQQASAVSDMASRQEIDPDMVTWDQAVSIHLSRQAVLCSEHRASGSQASEADKAQAFSRLVLLQGMQRVAAASVAMATYPPAALQKRPFGLPGDEAALDHLDCFKAVNELDKAFKCLPSNNHPEAIATEALTLWRALVNKASSLPSFSSAVSSGQVNGSPASDKSVPGMPASLSVRASGTQMQAAGCSNLDAAGSTAQKAPTASISGKSQRECAQQQIQQSAAQQQAPRARSHHVAMIPEELLPIIYVSWEFETMQLCVPTWDAYKAESRAKAAEPAAVRRVREAQAFQKICADAAARNERPSPEDTCVAAPRLTGALVYAKATAAVAKPFLQESGHEQMDDGQILKAAGYLNAACPVGLPNLYVQVAEQAASEVESWVMGKLKTYASLAARSRQSKLVQKTMGNAKQKYDKLDEHLEVLRDTVAQVENWMLHTVAGDCPPRITSQWLENACCKPGKSAPASFEPAWSAVTSFYNSFGKEHLKMAGQLQFLTSVHQLSTICYVAITRLVMAAGGLEHLLGQVQDSNGSFTCFAYGNSHNQPALPAADASSSRSAAAIPQSTCRSDEVAEPLLQEETAEKAAASGKKAKAKKKQHAQREVPPASFTTATPWTTSKKGRLGHIL